MPERLLQIPQPPKQLFVIGELKLDRPILSVVGTRKPTNYGRDVTEKLTEAASKAGAVIASGLAIGIDGIAHRAALEAGGETIAVLPAPVDDIYPRQHQPLAKQILKQDGALISEYNDKGAPGSFKSRLIERNRLVAGISDALLITEAAQRSGTTSTANFALDQGRTVMVVPGNITSAMSAGTNNLIKQGALPVTCVDDVLQILGLNQQTKAQSYVAKTPQEEIVLNLINSGIRDKQELLVKSGLETNQFNLVMTVFEIAKII